MNDGPWAPDSDEAAATCGFLQTMNGRNTLACIARRLPRQSFFWQQQIL